MGANKSLVQVRVCWEKEFVVQKAGSTVVVLRVLINSRWRKQVAQCLVSMCSNESLEKKSDMYRTGPVRTKGPAEGGETKVMCKWTSPLPVQWGCSRLYGAHLVSRGYRCS